MTLADFPAQRWFEDSRSPLRRKIVITKCETWISSGQFFALNGGQFNNSTDFQRNWGKMYRVKVKQIETIPKNQISPRWRLLQKDLLPKIGQLLRLSWLSGHFQHQRLAVQIPSSANFYKEHLFTVNCFDKTKIKKMMPAMAQ